MECNVVKAISNGVKYKFVHWCFVSVCQRWTFSGTLYACLLIYLIPTVICQTDWSEPLTFEKIYNTTYYAQLGDIQKPYRTPVSSANRTSHKLGNYNDVSSGNEVIGSYRDTSPLLVGFAKDPFRYSIPEEDYTKGVRNIDPKDYTNKNENRGKRGVFHLYNMIYCATGCDPLSYKGYGCYCGFLGSGRPTDGIDNCCKLHDECYENIYCPFYTVYLQPYYWKCYHGQPLCALENHNTRNQLINGCAGRLCECDRQFAMCVRRYRCPRKRSLCRSSPIRLLQNILMFR